MRLRHRHVLLALSCLALVPSCSSETRESGADPTNDTHDLVAALSERSEASYRAWLDAASPSEREAELSLGLTPALSFTRSESGTLRSITGHRMRVRVATRAPADDAEAVAKKFLVEIAPALRADVRLLSVSMVQRVPGGTVVRFTQAHDGLPVWSASAMVSLNDDLEVVHYFGNLVPDDAFAGVRSPTERASMGFSYDGSSVHVAPRPADLPHFSEHKEIFHGSAGLQYDDQCHASCPAGWCVGGVCQNPAASWPGTSKITKIRSDQVYDYWKNQFGWWSWDGAGMTMSVFSDDLDQCDANAYGNYINLGSGYTCTDVIGHEFTHNVLEQAAQFETGTIPEALSDVMGVYANRKINGSTSWTTADGPGCESCAAPQGRHSRLDDPEAYAWYGTVQPSNWSNWVGGTYESGTILGHAAFLMGREPAQGPHTTWGMPVTGIGLDLSSQIWFSAITACASSGMSFMDIRDCITAKACAVSTSACVASYDALDAVGIWRSSISLPWTAEGAVATVRRPISGGNTEEHVFYKQQGSNTVYWRMRQDCAFCGWSGFASIGLQAIGAPTAALVTTRVGDRIVICARQPDDTIACKYIGSDGALGDAGTNLGTTTDRPDLVRVSSTSLMLAWKTAGAGEQSIQYRTGATAWTAPIVSPATSAYGPSLAAGYDEQFPNAANGTWLVYRRSDGRIAYRKNNAGFGPEMLIGQADQAPTSLGAPTAAMFRGRLHVAAMQTANWFDGDAWIASCAQPCDAASTWTRWVKQPWLSGNRMHLDGHKDLRLYDTPTLGGNPVYRFKRSE